MLLGAVFLSPTVSAGMTPPPNQPCLYVTSFFYEALLCPVVLTGASASVQALLSSAVVVGPSDIGTCKGITTNPALSYQFFVEGDGSGCNYITYTQSNCKGKAIVSNLQGDQFKCMEAPAPDPPALNLGVMSYKVVCH